MNSLRSPDDNENHTPPAAAISPKTGGGKPAWGEPVSFPEWSEILALEPLDAQMRARFAKAIISYLRHCRDFHERASIDGAKRYLEAGTPKGPIDRDALRWFFVAHRRLHGAIFGGKGNKDRATVLAKKLVPKLRDHVDRLRGLFEQDRKNNTPAVWLPRGLERKFSAAGTQWQWQWLFPMAHLSLDRQTGIIRRHHVLDGTFQRTIKTAAQNAGIDKRVTPHVLRHYVERLTMWSSDQYYSENGAAIAA
jgi:hypothetical protein